MPGIIIADENEGRRTLLASALEKLDYMVTRLTNLRQVEATSLVAVPDVLVLDQTWTAGNMLDTIQRIKSDPKLDLNTRVMVLSGDTSNDFLVACTKAGINEVMSKPLNLNDFVTRVGVHAAKKHVVPPVNLDAQVSDVARRGGFFDTAVTTLDPLWALPMFKELVGPARVTEEFASRLLGELVQAEIDIEGLDAWTVQQVVLTAFDHLIEDAGMEVKFGADPSSMADGIVGADDASLDRLEVILDKQMRELEAEVEASLGVLDEVVPGEEEALLDHLSGRVMVAPESLEMSRQVLELAVDLLWTLGQPGQVVDPTLAGRVIELGQMTDEALDALPDLTPEARVALAELQGKLKPKKEGGVKLGEVTEPQPPEGKVGW